MPNSMLTRPTLRFQEFQGAWETITLSSICDLITKGTTPKAFQKGPVNFIKIESLDGRKIRLNKCSEIDLETHQSELRRSILKEGDILFAIAGATIGKVGVVDENVLPANTNQALSIIRLNDKNLNDFLLHTLSSSVMRKYIYQNIAVGAQPNISLGQMGDFKFSLPEKKEREKIADFLSSIDKKISLLKEKYALLNQYKKGVMQKLFKQEIRFKDDNGNDFPDWQIKPLSKLADKNSLKNKDNAVNAVLTNSAKSGIVNQGDYFNKDIANQGNLTGYTVVEKNDFIYNPRISELAPVGPIKRNHIGQGVMSPLYTAFRFKDENVLDYLEQYFNTTMWHRYMHSIANFGARHDRMNITSADFYALPLPIPSEAEREKIVSFIKALEAKVNAVNEQIELTQTFKKGLLQQMFV